MNTIIPHTEEVANVTHRGGSPVVAVNKTIFAVQVVILWKLKCNKNTSFMPRSNETQTQKSDMPQRNRGAGVANAGWN